MKTEKRLRGKRVLVIDDKPDVLDYLTERLSICMIDRASTIEEAKALLETYRYDIVVLDMMGVKGFVLLQIAKESGFPALMLSAHALNENSLNTHTSAAEGASYGVPKDEIGKIGLLVADAIEAREKKKNPWVKWFDRFDPSFYEWAKFKGPNWRKEHKKFWDEKLNQLISY